MMEGFDPVNPVDPVKKLFLLPHLWWIGNN
jgi:hypothetical protein